MIATAPGTVIVTSIAVTPPSPSASRDRRAAWLPSARRTTATTPAQLDVATTVVAVGAASLAEPQQRR